MSRETLAGYVSAASPSCQGIAGEQIFFDSTARDLLCPKRISPHRVLLLYGNPDSLKTARS